MNTFGLMKAVSDTIFDMIFTTYIMISPSQYQRLVMISRDYHVKYCVRNSLDRDIIFKIRSVAFPMLLY